MVKLNQVMQFWCMVQPTSFREDIYGQCSGIGIIVGLYIDTECLSRLSSLQEGIDKIIGIGSSSRLDNGIFIANILSEVLEYK